MTESRDDTGTWAEDAGRLRHDILRIDPSDERSARDAIANFMSEYGFDVEPVEMFGDLLELGYVLALRDVRDGKFDGELEEWGRPDV